MFAAPGPAESGLVALTLIALAVAAFPWPASISPEGNFQYAMARRKTYLA